MRLNPYLLKNLIGATEYEAGEEIAEGGGVRLTDENNSGYRYTVSDGVTYTVTLTRNLTIHCGCDIFLKKGSCRHAAAVYLTAEKIGLPEALLQRNAVKAGNGMNKLIPPGIDAEPDICLEATLILPRRTCQELYMGLRIGRERLYVVKDIRHFIECIENGDSYTLGKGFTFDPDQMRFSADDMSLLELVRKILAIQDDEKTDIVHPVRLIRIVQPCIYDVLGLLESGTFRIMPPYSDTVICRGISEQTVPLRFSIILTPRGLSVTGFLPETLIPITADCTYIMMDGIPVRTEKEQRKLLRTLWESQYNGKCIFEYPLRETENVIAEILPYLKLRGAVEMDDDLRNRLVKVPLKTEVYLDRDGNSVIATVCFRYGNLTINPFSTETEKITLDKGEKLLLRDAESEYRVLHVLEDAGFRVTKENIRLTGSEEIFRFIADDVARLQQYSDVFLSIEFKKITPRRPVLTGGMRMAGDHLVFSLQIDGEESDEVLAVIEALSKKRRYFRLRSGTFLDLSSLNEWQETAADIYEAAIRDGNSYDRDSITLRGFRTAYLTSLLREHKLRVETDGAVSETGKLMSGEMHTSLPPVPANMELKDYQKRGYEWMYTLDRLHMGGVLADDMGLGKTVQVIALLRAVREKGRTSIVVAPTSLTYNWLSEINRFAPELSAAVLNGNAAQRAGLIRHIEENGDVDVLITSYPLIRRDIPILKEIRFRFVILDEAQNIKNAGSVAAAAVKNLDADTRFALTGTPMENGVGELWSIFDFVLPGFLPEYNSFMRRYQDGGDAENLRRRIRPFLMRRLKQDVLHELPDKNETILTARMTPEQEIVYRAAMERLRRRVQKALEEKGAECGRSEVLSAIMELRQICCHPALVLSDYRGTSGKEELLEDLLPGLISGGRRILLFSQFTSMLKILEKKLNGSGYSVMYLDGDTPADQRLALTERFNAGGADIFLISLRAGGSGLNLTGADLVIHFDPWWNPATEEQATDRAYRIGQTHNVDVIRLVMGDSIEEQVTELGRRKKALFDTLITPGESGLSALSEQDIRNLFR